MYIKDRNYFLLTYKEGLYKLRNYVKDYGTWNKNKFNINIDYSEFCMPLHQLREKLVFFHRDFRIFRLTKEITNILDYIERLYTFVHTNSYKKVYQNQELSEIEKEYIIDKIICINCGEQNLLAFDNEIIQLIKELKKKRILKLF